MAHLWTAGITSSSSQGQSSGDDVSSIVVQLVSAVSRIEGEDESGVKERKVKEKVGNYLNKAKIVSGSAWEKMNGAGWIKFNTEIPTSTGDKWTADGVFHRSGVVVEKEGPEKSFVVLFFFLLVD